MESNIQGAQVMGFDDEITAVEGKSYELLPDGDYSFTVEMVEKLRYTSRPGGKIPACNQIKLTLICTGADGKQGKVFENIFLLQQSEWKISEFYRSIEEIKVGEKIRMHWDSVIGESGSCKIGIREYTGADGTKQKSNTVKHFMPYSGGSASYGNVNF